MIGLDDPKGAMWSHRHTARCTACPPPAQRRTTPTIEESK